jgi:hypothetical protein
MSGGNLSSLRNYNSDEDISLGIISGAGLEKPLQFGCFSSISKRF